MKTKTETGAEVELNIISNGMIEATVEKINAQCCGEWKQVQGREGFVIYTEMNGRTSDVCLTIPKADYLKVKTKADVIAKAAKEKEKQERLDLENSLKQHRVLALSGHYLCDEEIVTICVLDDDEQKKYTLNGRAAMLSTNSNDINIKKKDSKTAQEISAREKYYTFVSCESYLYPITKIEENQIIAECKAVKTQREEKKLNAQKIKEDAVQVIFDKAKETGEKQVLKSFPVDCQDQNDMVKMRGQTLKGVV